MGNLYVTIKTELDGNPGLYDGKSDQEVADELNEVNKPRPRAKLSGSDLWENTDASQFDLLPDIKKSQWLALCGIASIDPFGPAEDTITGIFAGQAGSTLANLQLARIQTVSKATMLGLGRVRYGDVVNARSIT